MALRGHGAQGGGLGSGLEIWICFSLAVCVESFSCV